MYSEDPAWRRLISHSLTAEERISLITTISLDDDQVKMVEQLSGDDAQTFVDVIDEVSFLPLPHREMRLIEPAMTHSVD